MQQIDIDFDVFKELTAKRRSEEHSCNDVLREILKLPAAKEEIGPRAPKGGRLLGGRFLQDGTKLRAKYKGQLHLAEISGSELVDEQGVTHRSASAAARSITKNSVNGLTFWEVKRPTDVGWQKLIGIPRGSL